MSWSRALIAGLIIVVYFVVATVLVPDWVLQLVASASSGLRDLIVLVVWTAGFGFGLYLLYWAQGRRLI